MTSPLMHGFIARAPAITIFAALALFPWWAQDGSFHISVLSRMMVFAIAAVGLNLILGFGGMVSLGHAMYLGIGAYSVAILSHHGTTSLAAHLAVGLAAGIPLAIAIGAVCVRTSGMAFIMITLAFSQMLYFAAVSLKNYGGDDGLPLSERSSALLDLSDPLVFYYLVLATLALTCIVIYRLVHSQFGMVLHAAKQNDRRALSLGLATQRHKIAAYAISAGICVVAGVLLANLTRFAAPSYMSWTTSGDLVLMCVLGGLSTVVGPIVGAAAFVWIEELLTNFPSVLPAVATDLIRSYWLGFFGLFVVFAVMFMKNGIYGAFTSRMQHADRS